MLAFVVLTYAISNIHFMNIRYRLILFFVSVSLIAFVLLMTKRTRWQCLLSVIMFVLAGVLFYTQYSLNQVVSPVEYEVVKYQVYTRIEDRFDATLKIGEVGQVHTRNEYALKTYQEMNVSKPNVVFYQDLNRMMDDLYSGKLNAVLLDQQFVSDLLTDDPEVLAKIKLHFQYEATVERDDIRKNVNILQEPYVVYISGIDVYGSTNTRSRSDLNILLVIHPKTHQILSVSIPRDTYLSLGCETQEKDKLTHAALYGVECSVATLESWLDLDINYYVRVNFSSLVHVVDALGGVEVESHYTFTTDSGHHFEKGMNYVDGKTALIFARERTNINQGDLSRGIHHQELIEGIFTKMMSPNQIVRLPALIHRFYNAVDTNFGYNNYTKLIANQIDDENQWSFTNIHLQGNGGMDYTYSLGNNFKYYVYYPSKDSFNEIKTQINARLKGE